jgi:hypothetical protein
MKLRVDRRARRHAHARITPQIAAGRRVPGWPFHEPGHTRDAVAVPGDLRVNTSFDRLE